MGGLGVSAMLGAAVTLLGTSGEISFERAGKHLRIRESGGASGGVVVDWLRPGDSLIRGASAVSTATLAGASIIEVRWGIKTKGDPPARRCLHALYARSDMRRIALLPTGCGGDRRHLAWAVQDDRLWVTDTSRRARWQTEGVAPRDTSLAAVDGLPLQADGRVWTLESGALRPIEKQEAALRAIGRRLAPKSADLAASPSLMDAPYAVTRAPRTLFGRVGDALILASSGSDGWRRRELGRLVKSARVEAASLQRRDLGLRAIVVAEWTVRGTTAQGADTFSAIYSVPDLDPLSHTPVASWRGPPTAGLTRRTGRFELIRSWRAEGLRMLYIRLPSLEGWRVEAGDGVPGSGTCLQHRLWLGVRPSEVLLADHPAPLDSDPLGYAVDRGKRSGRCLRSPWGKPVDTSTGGAWVNDDGDVFRSEDGCVTRVSLDEHFEQVVGDATSCARTRAAMYCWGKGGHGALGDGTTEASFEPVFVMKGVHRLASDERGTCARRTDGTLRCWGFGSSKPRSTFRPFDVPSIRDGVGFRMPTGFCVRRRRGAVACIEPAKAIR